MYGVFLGVGRAMKDYDSLYIYPERRLLLSLYTDEGNTSLRRIFDVFGMELEERIVQRMLRCTIV